MSVTDDDTKLFQNSIRYLHHVSMLPETNVPSLKSFICLKRRLMELRKSIFLPTNTTKPNMHCQRCFLNLFDGPATYKIKSKPTKYTFADKIKAKQRRGLPLTKYQQKYLKKLTTFSGNNLVTTCKFCKFEHFTKLQKLRTKPKPTISVHSNSSSKKKKKNKKDKFCGLNQNIVASISLLNDSNTNTLENSNTHNRKETTNASVICIDSDESIQEIPIRRKMKKKSGPIQFSTPLNSSTPNKKKEKNRDKLSEIFKNNSQKKKKSSHLMHFLQTL